MKCPKCGYEIPEHDDEEEEKNKMIISDYKNTLKLIYKIDGKWPN